MNHQCSSRCNNDIDCEVCPHGENIAQDECNQCYNETQDAVEKLLDNEIEQEMLGR